MAVIKTKGNYGKMGYWESWIGSLCGVHECKKPKRPMKVGDRVEGTSDEDGICRRAFVGSGLCVWERAVVGGK